jgi:hypothetical protein
MEKVKAFFKNLKEKYNGLSDEDKGWVVVGCGLAVQIGILIGLIVC